MKVVSKEIEVIAYFGADKGIRPLKFRIEEDNKWEVIKISKIINTNLEKICGKKMIVFTCNAVVKDIEKIFEIKFDIEGCKWILFKI